jgi:hypothetical protein
MGLKINHTVVRLKTSGVARRALLAFDHRTGKITQNQILRQISRWSGSLSV